MDLIFRSMSRAAGVEIPPGKRLPWEAAAAETPEAPLHRRHLTDLPVNAGQKLLAVALKAIGTGFLHTAAALEPPEGGYLQGPAPKTR